MTDGGPPPPVCVDQFLADDHDLSPAVGSRSKWNSSRVDAATTGRTPGKAIELFRVEAARRLLESTQEAMDGIARRTRFGKGLRPSLVVCIKLQTTGEAACAPVGAQAADARDLSTSHENQSARLPGAVWARRPRRLE